MLNFGGASYAAFRTFWATLFPDSPGAFGPGTGVGHSQLWASAWVRRSRYRLLWSFYDSTQYLGPEGESLRREMNLYKHIRPVLNVCGRIVDFSVDHIHGGSLDPLAGDGSVIQTCMPFILGEKAPDNLRPAIAAILKASNAASKKSVYNRWGAALGDVMLEPIPDMVKGRVRFRVVHPAEVDWITKDPYGNVKEHCLERWEIDPEDETGRTQILYKEEVVNDGSAVIYRTFRNNEPYQWPGTPGKVWESRWGFVPLVCVQNIDEGLAFGIAEHAAGVFKTLEKDDQKSNLSDGARKLVNTPWFLTGAALPPTPPPLNPWSGDPFYPSQGLPSVNTAFRPLQPPNMAIEIEEREGIAILTCSTTDGKMTPLAIELPVAEIDMAIRSLSEALEQDYPQLQSDKIVASGDVASGIAIDRSRQKASDLIEQRRGAYDDGFIRMLQMALTMGGTLGFPGFEGLGDGAYESGRLDVSIGPRPVFRASELEVMEKETIRADLLKKLTEGGMPFASALERAGYPKEAIEAVLSDKVVEDSAALERAKVTQVGFFGENPPTNGDGKALMAGGKTEPAAEIGTVSTGGLRDGA